MSLIRHYKLNDSAGDYIVVDSSISQSNGTATSTSAAMSVEGKINKAFGFPGTSVIDLGNPADLDFGTGSFSIALWSNALEISPNASSFGELEPVPPYEGEWFGTVRYSEVYGPKYNLEIGLMGTDGTWTDLIGPLIDGTKGTWHHFAFVKEGTSGKFYGDGLLLSTGAFPAELTSSTGGINIGSVNALGGVNFHADGLTDDFRIYNHALSSEEVSQIYNNGEGTEAGVGGGSNNSFYVKDLSGTWRLFSHYDSFNIKKRQNQPSEFEVVIYDIQDAEKAYFKEQAEVLFFANEKMILKGRIQAIEYGSEFRVIARGFGMESVLMDKEFIKSGDKRVQYTNESAQTMVQEILSENADGSSPWTMTPDTGGIFNSDYGDISMRFEYANKLNCLGSVANAIDYEWWVDQTNSDDYDEDYFNMSASRGGTSSEQTFRISGVSENAVRTAREKDITNMANYVSVLGYGDGINQLSTTTYVASTQSSTLSVDVTTSAGTSISLVDASGFDATGSARMAEEVFTYAGINSNTLTGCARGALSTTPATHKKGVYVEQYFTDTSPQSGSSISTYGKMESTQVDRTLLDRETAEVIASRFLIDHKDPIERITITPDEPSTDVANLEIGDLVTVIDDEAGINDSYRIVGIEYNDEYGYLTMNIEVANVTLQFIEQMQKEKEAQQNLQKYMQGATNIYAINEAENCDATHDLNMRFYLPEDAVSVNQVKLNFKLKDFRAYNGTGATTDNDAITAIAGTGTFNSGATISSNTWTTIAQITTANTDCEGVFLNGAMQFVSMATSTDNGSGSFRWRIYDGTSYYPNSSGYDMIAGGYLWNDSPMLSGTIAHYIPGNNKNKTYYLQVQWDGWSSDIDWTVNGSLSYNTFSKHTHDLDFGIYEENLTSPSVDVSVGVEGSEVAVGTYTNDQEDLDITEQVLAVGPGNWVNIKFEANKRMRIEADAYVKIFIESTTN